MKTIPFDIEKAKAGAKIVTASGNPVRVICYDCRHEYPVIALVDLEEHGECLLFTSQSGKPHTGDSADQLMIQVEQVTKWVAILVRPYDGHTIMVEELGYTEQEAHELADKELSYAPVWQLHSVHPITYDKD